jgi:hypothetical protein
MNNYILIDWNKPAGPLKAKPVKLTLKEAHQLNYAMALNGQTTRYIKVEGDV